MITIEDIAKKFAEDNRTIGIGYYIYTNGFTKDKKQAYKIDAVPFDVNDTEQTNKTIREIEDDKRFYAWCMEEKGKEFLIAHDKEMKDSWRKIIMANANTQMSFEE